MRALSFLAGHWEGSGTMTGGPGRTVSARATEHVEFKLDSAVLLIEGRGVAQRDGRDVIVHNALGVITWDSVAGRYDMRTWRAGGGTLAPDIEVSGQRITWGIDDPRAGRIRFTVTIDSAGQWHEVGEYSRDRTQWTPFFEMRLARKDPR